MYNVHLSHRSRNVARVTVTEFSQQTFRLSSTYIFTEALPDSVLKRSIYLSPLLKERNQLKKFIYVQGGIRQGELYTSN